MKPNFTFPRFDPRMVLAVGIALLFLAGHFALADDATNTAANSMINEIARTAGAGEKKSAENDYFGLPKEAFDRLTPEQIVALAQSRQKPFADERIPEMIMTVVVPICMFSMICVCVWLGVSTRLKRNRLLHETLRQMIDKGQPIPPELLQPQEPLRRPHSDLRTGLVLIGSGIGVGAFLFAQQRNEWPGALVPLLMGVAFLITWKLEANKNGQPK